MRRRLARVDGIACQHEFHRRSHAAQAHGPHGTAETGMDAQLNFGQAQDALVRIDGDAIVARQRQFESATQRMTFDDSDRRAGQVFQPIENPLALAHEFIGLSHAIDAREFIDVGAHDEAAGFSRIDNEARGQVDFDVRQQFVQFAQHRRR